MDTIREACDYETLPDGRVRCTLCPHECRIPDGARGACAVRINRRGRLLTLVARRVAARAVDPIEKKPLFHFLPGSRTYSVATVGCSLRCACCQNWTLSQWPKTHLPRHVAWTGGSNPDAADPALEALDAAVPGESTTPDQIVRAALAAGCASIAYTYVEPTIFFDLAYETAALAREAGLKNVFVTSGYIGERPLRRIAGLLDAVNVDLKCIRPDRFLRLSRGRLAPVLHAIRLYRELGVWTEVTTLVIPGVNDAEDDLTETAKFVRSLGAEVPWHVSRFHPHFEMTDRPPTPVGTLRRARRIGLDAGLRYVYVGNVPGERGENTYCDRCGALLLARSSVFLRRNRIRAGACPKCGASVAGVGMDGRASAAATA
jgi:pyruvate formate lyase activating enzyme